MKTAISYFCTILLSIFTLNVTSAQNISLGPVAGVNISTFNNVSNSQYVGGFAGGGTVNVNLTDNFGINGKVLFSQMGSGYERSTFQNRLNYLQVPVSAVYNFGNVLNRIRPKAYAGIYVASLRNGGDGMEGPMGVNQAEFESFDAGGQVGIGLDYRLRSNALLAIEVGYSAGVVGLADSPDGKPRNGAYNATVGWIFPIGLR